MLLLLSPFLHEFALVCCVLLLFSYSAIQPQVCIKLSVSVSVYMGMYLTLHNIQLLNACDDYEIPVMVENIGDCTQAYTCYTVIDN